jgi:hypothetical protein
MFECFSFFYCILFIVNAFSLIYWFMCMFFILFWFFVTFFSLLFCHWYLSLTRFRCWWVTFSSFRLSWARCWVFGKSLWLSMRTISNPVEQMSRLTSLSNYMKEHYPAASEGIKLGMLYVVEMLLTGRCRVLSSLRLLYLAIEILNRRCRFWLCILPNDKLREMSQWGKRSFSQHLLGPVVKWRKWPLLSPQHEHRRTQRYAPRSQVSSDCISWSTRELDRVVRCECRDDDGFEFAAYESLFFDDIMSWDQS